MNAFNPEIFPELLKSNYLQNNILMIETILFCKKLANKNKCFSLIIVINHLYYLCIKLHFHQIFFSDKTENQEESYYVVSILLPSYKIPKFIKKSR